MNQEQFKLFLEANCLLCKKFRGKSEDNCGTYRKIEMSQYASGLLPHKYLKEVPKLQKYTCKKFESKEPVVIKPTVKSGEQIGMF